jgi:hypothetical protein
MYSRVGDYSPMLNDKETGNALWIFIAIIIALLIGQSIYMFMTKNK